jgi:hypothetical protein
MFSSNALSHPASSKLAWSQYDCFSLHLSINQHLHGQIHFGHKPPLHAHCKYGNITCVYVSDNKLEFFWALRGWWVGWEVYL